MAPHRRRNRAAEQGANFINVTLIRRSWLALSFALWAVAGCNAIELVSERAFEEKVQSLRIGQANLAEIEALFGTAHVVERNP